MIQVNWNGRLGNKLFEYSIGRILAEQLNYELFSNPIYGFPGTQDNIKGNNIKNMHVLTGQHLDLNFISQNKGKLGFIINGWFQRYEYYKPYKEKIKTWFKKSISNIQGAEKDAIVAHVRRTQPGWDHRVPYPVKGQTVMASPDLLGFEWYKNILDRISFNKLYICTDVPNDPFLSYFKEYNPTIFARTELEDFNFIRASNRIISANSTFSWWAAFLSEAQEIYMPRPNYGSWCNPDDVNLIVNDEERYHVIDATRDITFF